MQTLATLTPEECWRRMGAGGVGRIGFDRGRGPRIHPVNYSVVDRVVYVRTSRSSELGDFLELFADGALVSFEVDQLDPHEGDRWSVLVVARPEEGTDAMVDSLRPGHDPEPEPTGRRDMVVRLVPVAVSGRRLAEVPPERGSVRRGRSWQIPDVWWG